MSILTVPSLYIDHQGQTAIVIRQTSSTVYCIAIDGYERTVKAYKLLDFLKHHREHDYPIYKACEKMLYSKLINCTLSANLELKGVLAMTTQNIKPTVIVVSRTAEFIGKFFDAKTASSRCDSNSLIVTSANDLIENFSKSQLVNQLPTSEQPTEVQLKNITKAQLAEKLFDQYMSIVVESPTVTSTKSSTPKTESAFHKLISQFISGEVLSKAQIVETYGCSEETAASMLCNMQKERYMKDRPTVKLNSGYLNDVKVYFTEGLDIESLGITQQRSTTMAKKVKAEGEVKEKKKGLKTLVRELLTDGPKTMNELIEATGSEKKLISDQLAYLQNPKYAGKEGALVIDKDPETKAYFIVSE